MKYPDKAFLLEYLSKIYFSPPDINGGNGNSVWYDSLGFTIKDGCLDYDQKFVIERGGKLLVSCIVCYEFDDIIYMSEYRLSPEDELLIKMMV